MFSVLSLLGNRSSRIAFDRLEDIDELLELLLVTISSDDEPLVASLSDLEGLDMRQRHVSNVHEPSDPLHI